MLIERRRQEFGEDTRRACGDGEVAKEARVIPVGEGGNEHALEVGEDGLERLAVLRRVTGQCGHDVARRHAWEHRVALGVGKVVGDPLDQRVAVPTELGWIHVNFQVSWAG